MRPGIGTYEWTEQHDGKLNFREKLRMAGWLVRSQVQELWEKSLFKKSWRNQRLGHIDLDKIKLPDTPLVQEASEYVAEIYSAPLLNHVYRCYYWAGLLAQFDGLQYDPELFMMADLFHDIVLTDKYVEKAHSCCFTKDGARMGEEFVATRGWEQDRGRRVYGTISLHLNPFISKKKGAEEHLLGAAATFDLLGSQFHKIPEAVILAVHERHRRIGIKEEILQKTGKEFHAQHTRARFYASLGAGRIMEWSPLDREKFLV